MILLIDSQDSFFRNLRRLIQDNTSHEVVTIFNDTFSATEYAATFATWIRHFDYIVIGPGPGHPAHPEDVGIIRFLFQHFQAHPDETVPVLGVCLGLQSMCHEFGCTVLRLDNSRHGQIDLVRPVAGNLFSDTTPFASVRYHLLHVCIDTLAAVIEPLAVCIEPDTSEVLMAARHRTLPLYGVQYHPESVCSERGDELIRRFDALAAAYNARERPDLRAAQADARLADGAVALRRAVHEKVLVSEGAFQPGRVPRVFVRAFSFAHADTRPIDVCDYLATQGVGFVFLNSAADPGNWSVIGLPLAGESELITHSVDQPRVVRVLHYGAATYDANTTQPIDSIMKFVATRMEQRYVARADIEKQLGAVHSSPLPFLGGYMGLFSYEEGRHLVTAGMEPICREYTPDCKLVYVERFILHDRAAQAWFMVLIRDADDEALQCQALVDELLDPTRDVRIDAPSVAAKVRDCCRPEDRDIQYQLPDRDTYRQQFALCQEHLHAGNSYELCLTTQLKIMLPKYLHPWTMYKILALRKNPSPYLCYMNFDDCVLLLLSPERFLSWKDSGSGRKIAELRPIKGTVRRTESTTFEDAVKILRTPKEMRENLMIVDLIRHDLQTFTDAVHVDALMAIEEYHTVYQMVTVIQGQLQETGYKGIDLLQLSLPPGSMTGAPKKRLVELLQKIEALQPTMSRSGRRGIYSGVAGYWSVTDDADWSVIIRSMVHYKEDRENTAEHGVWRIGAGGAITVLSDEAGEWDEMELKLQSTLQTFV
ncbi:para-aminobenzoate synthase [Metschnikowia bicuspidata]|uniref:aminodeoxychorismate synthase n=1 Tax=Metschnikowia bicuspidata TaxID=27322 RepID=A0A4P9ZGN0_9ASCO|nr:para-aminobenzoate synthase [Metschnikowia bicuspidata]